MGSVLCVIMTHCSAYTYFFICSMHFVLSWRLLQLKWCQLTNFLAKINKVSVAVRLECVCGVALVILNEMDYLREIEMSVSGMGQETSSTDQKFPYISRIYFIPILGV